MRNTIVIIGIFIFLGIFFMALFSEAEAQTRKEELGQRINDRSIEWQQEAQYAERGRIAQDRMAALNRQNNIDRLELQKLGKKE